VTAYRHSPVFSQGCPYFDPAAQIVDMPFEAGR